jgi:hypothetical protein
MRGGAMLEPVSVSAISMQKRVRERRRLSLFCREVEVLKVLGCCLLVNSAHAISPTDIPSTQLPNVTVTAPRNPTVQELAQESVPHFVLHHAKPAKMTEQLARWRNGICPIAIGLDVGYNEFVSRRLRAVAADVGAPTQQEGKCSYNVDIIFTNNPQGILDEVVKEKKSILLGFNYQHQEKKLATFNRPIQAWYVTATRGAGGDRQIDDAMSPPDSMPHGLLGSRLATGLSSEILHVLIIADTSKVVGDSIGSISDYIAVLALTLVPSLDNCDPLPSILDLMSVSCAERERADAITAGDLAFLKALYQTDLELVPSLERSNILNNMMHQFGGR